MFPLIQSFSVHSGFRPQHSYGEEHGGGCGNGIPLMSIYSFCLRLSYLSLISSTIFTRLPVGNIFQDSSPDLPQTRYLFSLKYFNFSFGGNLYLSNGTRTLSKTNFEFGARRGSLNVTSVTLVSQYNTHEHLRN